ncbi:serine hydrolase [Flagellimonas zhangzhouensis]|uniref:CubicO group peptidase, beta-lactamase class C family n=1 Tax=Flagellimonas zhangzhouensis TaxID=1073328 RepID=A0A1H2SR11_9FLAO|nr:serine hydrolase [Allomuricauda zhangzhouensis]SDQ78127.1 CubicO group peptidase, beta-lactamase class C family [Allomuricauda zhangzhouensis]SDW34066.1 CubicO group peptidase, beta-lactamase class C family [Allomuricauda zhangzhouensis]
MKNQSLLAILLLCVTLGFSQTDKRLKNIEKVFEDILEATHAPGFAVAIVEGDKTIYAKGFGYRDVENKIPMDENTLLAIGSSSKAFTSAILGQLRNNEALTFNDSPIEYIPELRFYNNQLNGNINIRDLMSHQTGIPRHDGSWYLFPTFNRDSLVQRIQYQEPFTGLRQKWHYNNFMFLLQGVIAERITGKSWEENIQERFFRPLQMNRSNVSIKELENSENAALGYEYYKDSITRKMDYYRIAAMAPAGSINSSVSEMANWLKVWINNGKFKDSTILPENYMNEAMSSQSVISSGFPSDENPDLFLSNYGYGWMISSYRGHYRVEHGGNIDGFSASVAFYPTDSLGIVVLTNQNGSRVPSMVRNTVADRMLNEKKGDWVAWFNDLKEKQQKASEAAKKASDSTEIINTTPSHDLSAYTGYYENQGYGRFEITKESDSLFAHFKLIKFYLKHKYYDIFEPLEVTSTGIEEFDELPVKFNFSTNNSGDISSVNINVEPSLDHPIEFKREPKALDIDVSELKKYEGTYELTGIEIKVYIKGEGLYMFVPGQPEYNLLATGEDGFNIKGLEGFKTKFRTLDNDMMKELVLIQPNGTFVATRK